MELYASDFVIYKVLDFRFGTLGIDFRYFSESSVDVLMGVCDNKVGCVLDSNL